MKIYEKLDACFTSMGWGMRGKLIALFVLIKVAPLCLLSLLAWSQFEQLGMQLTERTVVLADKANQALTTTGDIAVDDAIDALDNLAQENIERMTTDAAKSVADFLYSRDFDILYAASLEPDPSQYQNFINTKVGRLVKQGEWALSAPNGFWLPMTPPTKMTLMTSSNTENDLNFNYRPPTELHYYEKPLFLEMTFVSPEGMELIKVSTSTRMDKSLKDISRRENTFVKAETYFADLKKLKPGEIYVSDVIGAYVPSKIIGIFNPANAEKAGIDFEPEKWAFAGKENPKGKRFEGIVRWATPVERDGKLLGYVTLALDHDHIMTFMDHITPVKERYTELSDAYEGNYAFIWDYKGRSIVHPRHHSITGYDPETGLPQVPWLEKDIYERWQASGMDYVDFILNEPTFVDQSIQKAPAANLTKQGLVGLDCRYLNFAPQCTGWFDLTGEGGSGSFNILWSGLRKLTTAATIPYYTGQYANSPRGFGFVATGAGLDDFHRPATETGVKISELITDTNTELKAVVNGTTALIAESLKETAISLSASTGIMILLVVLIAVWMASIFTTSITDILKGMARFRNGERQFRFKPEGHDELNQLCKAFDSLADSVENNAPGTMVITDLNGMVVYVNSAFLQVNGKSIDEVLGKPYAQISLFKRNDPLSRLWDGLDSNVIMKHGNEYYRGSAEEHKNSEGVTIGYIVTTTNVTHMMETQQKSEEQRKMLDIIFAASPDLMWYKGADGTYLAINPRFASVFGLSIQEIIGRNLNTLHGEMANYSAKCDREVLRTRCSLRSEESIIFADGHTETVEAVRTPIFNSQGEYTGVLGVARDITERNNIATTLRSTQKELEQAVIIATEANNAKGQFLANMSHEIRTPMNAILGFTHIALRGTIPHYQRDMFQKIQAAAKGLLSIISDVLDFSKIEARKLEVEKTPYNLTTELCQIYEITEMGTLNKHIDFNFHFMPQVCTLGNILGDAGRLRQILVNVLSNAVKFTEFGGVILEVEVEEKSSGSTWLHFAIHDTGIGMEKDAIERLFKPFSQADGSITRRFGGTGLGLAISKELVELMGGSLNVESHVGFGSTFYIDIPAEKATQEHIVEAKQLISPEELETLKGKKALLVEDNHINQIIARNLLEHAGMTVVVANNGVEALESLLHHSFDVVLMDIQMPVMDGLEACRRIRNIPQYQLLPIIAMTAHAMSDDYAISLDAGMSDHITKPIDPDVLMIALIKNMQ